MSNLIQNPTFEVNANDWFVNGATLSRSTEQAHSGVASGKAIFDGSVAFEGFGNYPQVAAAASTRYSGYIWLYDAIGGATLDLSIYEYLGTTFIRATSAPTTTVVGWQQLTQTVVTGAGIDGILLVVQTGATADAVTVYVDDAFLSLGNTADIFYVTA